MQQGSEGGGESRHPGCFFHHYFGLLLSSLVLPFLTMLMSVQARLASFRF